MKKVEDKAKKIEDIENEKAELLADLQRVRADFENYRKQIEAQKMAEKKAARFATVHKMLPLLDDMARAIDNYAELKPLEKTLTKVMNELGLERIDSSDGVEFDPVNIS